MLVKTFSVNVLMLKCYFLNALSNYASWWKLQWYFFFLSLIFYLTSKQLSYKSGRILIVMILPQFVRCEMFRTALMCNIHRYLQTAITGFRSRYIRCMKLVYRWRPIHLVLFARFQINLHKASVRHLSDEK